ncbi:MAG: hypothetical protein DRJ42_13565 [Deltaproteobacteria bacterium]|nr:MAG: hypothetical protein DRJ42_13565 [Deltaproteobacteria bacterium]
MLNWWPGAIACENPRRGIWGGPPNGRRPPAASATNTAFIRRRRAPLERWIRDDVPEINLRRYRPPASAPPAPKTRGPVLGKLGGGGVAAVGAMFGLFLWRRRKTR